MKNFKYHRSRHSNVFPKSTNPLKLDLPTSRINLVSCVCVKAAPEGHWSSYYPLLISLRETKNYHPTRMEVSQGQKTLHIFLVTKYAY